MDRELEKSEAEEGRTEALFPLPPISPESSKRKRGEAVERFSISVPVGLAMRLRASVEVGDYRSINDIVREALLAWEAKEEAKELQEAQRIGQGEDNP